MIALTLFLVLKLLCPALKLETLKLGSEVALAVKCYKMGVILHLPHIRAAVSALHRIETYFLLLFSILCSLSVSSVTRELNKYLTWLEGGLGFCLLISPITPFSVEYMKKLVN